MSLDQSTFADRFFERNVNDSVVRTLHNAVIGAALATSSDDLREAAEKVAKVIKDVGIDRWPRYVADAVARARDPAIIMVAENNRQPPDPGRDAIRPAYPVETAIGVAAAGIAGGAVAAARAVGGAILKQVLPDKATGTLATGAVKPSATSPATEVEQPQIARQKQDGHIRPASP